MKIHRFISDSKVLESNERHSEKLIERSSDNNISDEKAEKGQTQKTQKPPKATGEKKSSS